MSEYNDNLHKNSKASTFENARSLRKTQTKAEQILWEALRNDKVCKLKFRRQHPFDNYILDFYNHKMKLAIEVDGEVHNHPEVSDYDKVRTTNLSENGITVLRFSNNEVENNLKTVIKKIEDWFEENDFVAFEPWPDEDAIEMANKSIYESEDSKAPSPQGEGWGEINESTLKKNKRENELVGSKAPSPQGEGWGEVNNRIDKNDEAEND